MSTVLKFHRPHQRKPAPSLSEQRLSDILTNIIALVSRVEALQLQTTEDLREAIFILDLANMCIRPIIRQIIMNDATKMTLLAQSAKIDQLIEATRKDAATILKN